MPFVSLLPARGCRPTRADLRAIVLIGLAAPLGLTFVGAADARRASTVPARTFAEPAALGLAPAATAHAAAAPPAPGSPPLSPSTPAPMAPYQAIVSMSASRGVVSALREVGDGTLELLIGSGQELVRARGVPPIVGGHDPKNIVRAHLGTNAAGKAVVVYPRCTPSGTGAAASRSCDLVSYDIDRARERRLPGIRKAGRDEFEGVMDRGALLYAAHARRGKPGDRQAGLWYRPSSGRQRRIARNPGWDLALRNRNIAHVISDGAKNTGEEPCANRTLVLRSIGGKARAVARECIREDSGRTGAATPSFLDRKLSWVRVGESGPSLLRFDLSRHTWEEASVEATVFGFRATGRAAGIAQVVSASQAAGGGEFDAADTLVPLDPIAWSRRTGSAVQAVPFVVDHPFA